ncbi:MULTISPECIES: hypothetical protein [unclassified Streptomyces]|uniref:hypothetical protein n=1 Tax=unclassified Streptomyces TaxID=2593676 RepID=UPI002034752D|nr:MULTISPECIES: hypothetical protein [unclassified Streptomyces]MCM2417229.1 hypothetical protein [Streptomyces sp. RKAG293]MCM2430545.1 hypothetical protein [Streptomyces sp. RKAG337]
MPLPATHQCRTCSTDATDGATLHEDLVVGAPLSMEALDEAQRLDRFARKYAHDGCRVTEVRQVPSGSTSGYAWSVRFLDQA